MGDISVVVPAYNAERFIERTLCTVYAQTLPPREVIVVDDGSRDGTSEIVARLARQAPVPTTLLCQANAGPAAARNHGVAHSRGEYVAYVDADDEWLPEKLERQAACLSASPTSVLCHTGVVVIDVDGNESPVASRLPGTTFEELLAGNFIVNSSVIVRRAALGDAPFNPRRDFIAAEDYDLWLRLARRSPICYARERLVRYRIHSSGLSRASLRCHDAERAVLEEVFTAMAREGTLDPSVRRRRLAQISYACGKTLLDGGDRVAARAEFLRAFRNDLSRLSALGMVVATLSSPETFAMVRSVFHLGKSLWRSAAPHEG